MDLSTGIFGLFVCNQERKSYISRVEIIRSHHASFERSCGVAVHNRVGEKAEHLWQREVACVTSGGSVFAECNSLFGTLLLVWFCLDKIYQTDSGKIAIFKSSICFFCMLHFACYSV